MVVKYDNEVIGSPTEILRDKFIGKTITIGIDSSKTNTAFAIGNSKYTPIAVIEVSGTGHDDIFEFSCLLMELMESIFSSAKIVDVGIENIISKDDEVGGGKTGIYFHNSRFLITTVFAAINIKFRMMLNKSPTLINNQVWKTAVLPPELRKRTVKKGSLEYIANKYPKYRGYTDDATDALCILETMSINAGMSNKVNIEEIDDEAEISVNNYIFRYGSINTKMAEDAKEFVFNPNLTEELNAIAISNRLNINQLGYAKTSIENLSLNTIYTRQLGKFDLENNEVIFIVKRQVK